MPLTDTICRSTKAGSRLRKLSDGGGLQLWLLPQGSKLWRLAYRYQGRQKLISFGAYPEVTLAEARGRRDAARRQLRDGVDPSVAKRAAAVARQAPTFNDLCNEYITKLKAEQRAVATIVKADWVLGLAAKQLGHKMAAEISPRDVRDALLPIQSRGRYETARRTKTTVSAVFRYAIANGKVQSDPTVALRGALISPPVKHRAAVLELKPLAALLRAIEGYNGHPTTLAALKLAPLLFVRPGELRTAEWVELDIDQSVWTIPASKTKMRKELRVPLPRQAVHILLSVQALELRSPYVFPSVRSLTKPMSENTLNAALRTLGFDKDTVTAHGFRATASTLLNESGRWAADAIELQLGHVTQGVRRAYARGLYWPDRVRMMQWWADHLDSIKSGKAQVLELNEHIRIN